MASSTPTDKAAKGKTKKELKILMLHGYTQSGPLFRAKTRAVEKLLVKSLAPFSLSATLIYPTGPIRLSPANIPNFSPVAGQIEAQEEEQELDSWAWFLRDDVTQAYSRFDEGMTLIADTIRAAGGVDGVVGFSQGGAMAALLAAALETDPARSLPEADEEKVLPWLTAVRAANNGKALRFAVVYSGFFARDERLAQWLYEPKIKTPTLHYLGGLDTVVEEARSQGLVERCEDPVVMTHPGGHYVPVSREWVMPLVGFVKKYSEES